MSFHKFSGGELLAFSAAVVKRIIPYPNLFLVSFRCKMRHRDSRLFFLSMEVSVRKAGVRTILNLDDDARPALLQACQPKGDSRFLLHIETSQLQLNKHFFYYTDFTCK